MSPSSHFYLASGIQKQGTGAAVFLEDDGLHMTGSKVICFSSLGRLNPKLYAPSKVEHVLMPCVHEVSHGDKA